MTLKERVYIHKLADTDQTIDNLLKKAKRIQRKRSASPSDSIDTLLDDLNLNSTEPDNNFVCGEDDLGDWFRGAPSWICRS